MTQTPAFQDEPKVLIAEDSGHVALLCAEYVQDAGCRVVGPARSNAEARSLIEAEGGVDAALLDVSLTDGDVFPLADELMARGVPIAFCTGFSDDSSFDPAHRDAPRLIKPYEYEDLCSTLSALLQGREPAGR